MGSPRASERTGESVVKIEPFLAFLSASVKNTVMQARRKYPPTAQRCPVNIAGFLLLCVTSLCSAAGQEQGDPKAEQAGAATPAAVDKTHDPVAMQKVDVHASKREQDQLHDLARALNPPKIPISLENGGMVHRRFLGRDAEVGVQKNEDLFEQDARYSNDRPMVKVDFLRMRF